MSKVEEFRKTYNVHPSTFEKFVNADKTTTKKYLEYYLKFWSKYRKEIPPRKQYTVDILANLINDFDKHISYIENKDIYSSQYYDISELEKVVEAAKMKKLDSSFVREENADVIYEDDKYLFLNIRTFEASKKYGANTRWCTTARGGESTFKNYVKYSNGSVLAYLLDKKTNKKFAFHCGSVYSSPDKFAIFDDKDVNITTDTFLSRIEDEMMGGNLLAAILLFNIKYRKVLKARATLRETKDVLKNIDFGKLVSSYEFLTKNNASTNKDISEIKDRLVSLGDLLNKIKMMGDA